MRAVGTKLSDTATSLTLLESLLDPCNDAAWRRFGARYRPMVVRFAAKLGLSAADAQDAAQEAMMAFVEAYRQGAYDRSKGRLRSWLCGIAYRKVKNIQRRMRNRPVVADQSAAAGLLASVEASNEVERLWEEEWQRAVLDECMDEVARHVDPTTFEAFGLYVLQQWPAEQVAGHLGISRSAVYNGKNRVLNRMRDLRRQIEDFW